MGDKTGIIYNNVMRDFSIGNTTDVYGLAPNQLNEVEPGEMNERRTKNHFFSYF